MRRRGTDGHHAPQATVRRFGTVGQREHGSMPPCSSAQTMEADGREHEVPEAMIRVEVRASVPYSEIAAQALAVLERRPVAVDTRFVRGQLHVRDVRVHASGARLAVAVSLQGDLAWPLPRVRGTLALSATPVYDAETQTLRLSDVTVTADVDHVLARAAFAYKRGEIVDALAGASFDAGPLLRDLRDRLNASLSGGGSAAGVALQGHVETMRVHDVLLAEELVVVASASGRLRVSGVARGVD
jgi:hypothetical protein